MNLRLDSLRINTQKTQWDMPGFTLVELLVVIAATGILIALTVPVGLRFYERNLVADTARNLQSVLWRARTYAIAARNDQPAGVRILPGQFVLFQGASYASRTASLDEIFSYEDVVTVTGTVSEIVFSKLYATSTASGTMQVIGNAGTSLNVTISPAGRVDLP
jgi:prepilin-type N-terminal cleavage/methylation domain-containing protein